MGERTSTRLGFLRRGASATLAAGVGTGIVAAGASAGEADRFVGTIVDVRPDGARVAVEGAGVIELTLAANADISHGPAAERSVDLAAFRLNDEIAFTGTGAGGTVAATSVHVVYRNFSGVVISDEGSFIRTTSGDILIPSSVRRDLPPKLDPGQTLTAATQKDPETRLPVAALAYGH